jgi:predicted restriction endonuclease
MIYGNLPPATDTNETTKYFDNFFSDTTGFSPNVDDAVISYFQSVTGNKESGTTLAATVIYTALQQKIDPLLLIDEFRKLKPGELNAYLTMFLNVNRVGTSLLGISNSPQTNKYITRAILP